jgi:hypothetical protein
LGLTGDTGRQTKAENKEDSTMGDAAQKIGALLS